MAIDDSWKKFFKPNPNLSKADIRPAKDVDTEITKRDTIRARAAKKDLN